MKVNEEQVWSYLAGELDEPTATRVANAIDADENLQQLVDDYQKLLAGFREQRIQGYADEAMEAISEVDDKPKEHKKNYWWLAAIVVAIFMLAAWLMMKPTKLTAPAIAQIYFRLPADPSIAGNTTASKFNTGLEAFFAQKDYALAIENWEPITSDSLYGISASYYLGHAYFLNSNYQQALEYLQQSLTREDVFSQAEQGDLSWNILLTQLALGKDIQSELTSIPPSDEKKALEGALEKTSPD